MLQYGIPSGYSVLDNFLKGSIISEAKDWYVLVPYGDIVLAPAKAHLEIVILGNQFQN